MKSMFPKTRWQFGSAILLVLAAAAPARADYQSSVLAQNPLAYWRFNETATSPPLNKVANSGTVGSAADGYVVMDVAKGEPGIVGNSARFSNPGNVVGYAGSKIDVPFNQALNPNPPFSIEFWAKPNSLGADGTGFCPLSSFNPNWFGGANRSGWLFYLNNAGRWNFRLGNPGGYSADLKGTSGNAAAGVWQHIVATYDGNTARLYANGALIGSYDLTAQQKADFTPNSQMALRMGATPLQGSLSVPPANSASGIAGNRGFDGWLDEVAVYPTALSATTIAAHYSAATTNAAGYSTQILADSPLGYWPLNEPAVTAPNPASFPKLANSGSVGAGADGTNTWGSLTAQNGPAYTGFGADNRALYFNGESGHVLLPDAAGLHFSGSITMMAWVKPAVEDYFRNIIAHGFDDAGAETFLRISRGGGATGYGDDNANYYEVGTSDGINFYDSAVFQIPKGDIGNWVFIAGTYDGQNWNLYRNGALVATLASANGATDVTNRWSIGSRSDPSPAEGLFFGGWIDEPAIFSAALPAATINSLYNAAQVPPIITQGVAKPAGSVFKGSSASFSVWAEGTPPLSYNWLSNGVPLGVSATNLTINSFAIGNPTIAVVVTNAYGSVTSSVTFAVVAAPPSITTQPVAATRYDGRPFSFSAGVSGSTPLTYQWKTNGTAIPGATTATYSGIATAANAYNYSLSVSNEAGQAETTPVALTVLPRPSGYAATIMADSPVAYWRLGEKTGNIAHDYYSGLDGTYFNVTLGQPGYSQIDPDTAIAISGLNSYVGNISGTGVNFPGHTNFTLEVWVNGQPGQSDEATIIAKGSGSSGTTATEQFALDVQAGNYHFFTRGNNNSVYEVNSDVGPDGTWQYLVAVYNDDSATMELYVNGALHGTGATRPAGLRNSSNPVTIGSKHLGNDPNFDAPFNGTIDEVAVYRVALPAATIQAHFSAAYGDNLAPFIDKQPLSVTNYVTLPGTLVVGAAGTTPLAYQWKKGGVAIADATSSSYTIPSLALSDAGSYSVTISNTKGTTNSATVQLTVLSAPTTPVAIPGLVLHLTFDNSLVDVTGRGNNGTSIHISGTSSNVAPATYAADGRLGGALHYATDPTTTNNTFVTLGVRPDLKFGSNVNFTVAYWIRLPANYVLGDLPFFTDTVGSTYGPGFVFAPSYGPATANWPGGWAVSLFEGGGAGTGVGVYGDIGSINDGAWHHLLHVIDRTSGMVTYLDGSPAHFNKKSGTSVTAAGNIDTGHPATIGQDPTGTYPEAGSADIDDLGVWRRALSPLEAASVYMAAVNGQSFVYVATPVSLSAQKRGDGKLQINWSGGALQSSSNAATGYTDIPGAPSPYIVTPSGTMQFFRVRQ